MKETKSKLNITVISYKNIAKGKYSISPEGIIRSVSNGNTITQFESTRGYNEVKLLTTTNSLESYPVHKIMAEVFIPMTDEDKECKRNKIKLLNNIKTDYTLSNLLRVNQFEINILNTISKLKAITPDANLEYYSRQIDQMVTRGLSNERILTLLDMKNTFSTRLKLKHIIAKIKK